MANACAACNGMGFGEVDPDFGYRDNKVPCKKCNPEGTGAPPKKATKGSGTSVAFVDGPAQRDSGEGLTLDQAVEQGWFDSDAADASLAEELKTAE